MMTRFYLYFETDKIFDHDLLYKLAGPNNSYRETKKKVPLLI